MAQRTKRNRLLRRLGITGKGGSAVVCAALAVCLAGGGALYALAPREGFEIERSAPSPGGDADAEEPEQQSKAETDEEPDEKISLVVHVDGAVQSPGVYELVDENARVSDAVESAGGLCDDADTSTVNLAAHLVDGQKVHIPRLGEEPVQQDAAISSQGTELGGAVNINTATTEELKALPGVGDATAAAIVEERERGGPFASPEDIMRVTGIGQKKFERMRGLIVV